MDAETFRQTSRERWEAAARGWEARRAAMQSAARPVSDWMVAAIAPRRGETILELAAGPGDTGFLAAELLGSDGRLISTDGAEAMVEVARRRAEQLGLDNVEHRVMEAEWIDLEAASVDAVLCRWGYMLLADPEAALRETRRVLRSGGRLALAVWDEPANNPWATIPGGLLVERGLVPRPEPGDPGMFAMAAPGRIEELLGAAGFSDVVVDAVEFEFGAPSFDEFWEERFDLSPGMTEALSGLDPEQRDELHDAVQERLAPFTGPGGEIELPARSLVASASA